MDILIDNESIHKTTKCPSDLKCLNDKNHLQCRPERPIKGYYIFIDTKKNLTHAHITCHLAMTLFATALYDTKSLNVTIGKRNLPKHTVQLRACKYYMRVLSINLIGVFCARSITPSQF